MLTSYHSTVHWTIAVWIGVSSSTCSAKRGSHLAIRVPQRHFTSSRRKQQPRPMPWRYQGPTLILLLCPLSLSLFIYPEKCRRVWPTYASPSLSRRRWVTRMSHRDIYCDVAGWPVKVPLPQVGAAGSGRRINQAWVITGARRAPAARSWTIVRRITPSRFGEHRDVVFTVRRSAAVADRDICAAAGDVRV